jgi:S1-C subfamily serine protease
MRPLLRSHLASAVVGGLVVAGAFLALGITGRRTTQTIVEESPVAGQPASNADSALTPHAIYTQDAPGVVFVRAQLVRQVQDPFDMVPGDQNSSTGSGFLVDSRGDILTSYHVIEGADRNTGVTVQFADNVARHATVVGEDPNDDLAVLRVEEATMPHVDPLLLGDSTTVRVGDPTLAIGNPFGYDRTLTSGIVSALQRQIQAPNGFSIDNVIQTDAPINPGNSGGPLLDADGRVVGINSQIAAASNGGDANVGIAFAVPINTAKSVLAPLEAGRPVRVAWLGLNVLQSASNRNGVTVAPAPGGPSANAGLRSGDVVEAIAGRKLTSAKQLQEVVAASTPGQSVNLRVRRGSRTASVTVVLGSRPAQAPQ